MVPFSSTLKESLEGIVFDESIWTYMGFAIRTEAELEEYVQATLLEKLEGKSYSFIVLDKESKLVLLQMNGRIQKTNYLANLIRQASNWELIFMPLSEIRKMGFQLL